MRGFIKLTDEDGGEVYVRPEAIQQFHRNPKYHVTNLNAAPKIHFVMETPQDIAVLLSEAEGSPEYALDLPEEVRGLVRQIRAEQERFGQEGVPTDAHLADLQMLDEIREAVGSSGPGEGDLMFGTDAEYQEAMQERSESAPDDDDTDEIPDDRDDCNSRGFRDYH